jgi:acyl-homoserine lactone acylase PvdQ
MTGPLRRPAPRRAARLLTAAAALAAAACDAPAPATAAALDDAERREIAAEVERRLRAATDLRGDGDVLARLLGIYPDSGRVVSAAAGSITTTRDSLAGAVASFWADVGRNMRNPEWRWGPMHVDVLGPDAAVVTAAYRIPHLTPRGQPHVVGGAWTAVFARRGGEWVVVQEHLSDAPGALSPTP